jgi:NhaC family Na+:H+ antiporter
MEPRKPSLALTLVVFLAAALLIGASVLVWEVDIHIALILSAMIAIAVGVVVLKNEYSAIEKGIIEGIMTGMQACLILYTVGPLVGTWILRGVIPSMIYYGLSIPTPASSLLQRLSFVQSLHFQTGTSSGNIGTVGIALRGSRLA